MQRLYILTLTGAFLLLGACGDLERKIDLSLYGSEEKAEAAHEEFQAEQSEKELKKQRKMEKELFDLIAAERQKNKLKTPRWDEKLQGYARIRAKEVSERNSKYRPNGEFYTTLYDEYMGEKMFSGMKEARSTMHQPKAVISNWLWTKGTRAILMAPYLLKYAVGVFKKGSTYYWVVVTTK